MDARKLPSPVTVTFALAAIVLVLDAASGPGWTPSTVHVLLATRADHTAASPLYDAIAAAFTLLPAGEPGFRLGVLAALLGACTLAGVVAAARALLPKDPIAGVVGATLLVLAPPFREAAAFPTPSLLAAAGATWALAFALRYARGAAPVGATSADAASADQRPAVVVRDARHALTAVALCVLVIGSTPWLGAAFTAAIVVGLVRVGARRDHLAICVGALGVAIVVLWIGAAGSLPGASPGLAALAAAGRGAAAIVVGAGLLGVAFAGATGLPRAGWLAAPVVLAFGHEAIVGGSAPVLLALLATCAAILPSALVRVADNAATGLRRHLVTLAAGAPLVAVATLTGATFSVEDPGPAPAQLAHDLVDAVPPGIGIFVATRPATWLAIEHEATVAGARPDLALVPPLPPERGDAIVANALRDRWVVGADVAAFGRLDITRAIPRGRGFQLVGDIPPPPTTVAPPAHYATATGAEQAILLALERARFEAANGRLDAAARAAGLAERFGAADLAILGAVIPSKERPALFGFLPTGRLPIGPWLLDTFGDDLAWVGGIPLPDLAPDAPMPRKLHALWRLAIAHAAKPDAAAVSALGPDAVAATKALFE